MLDRLARRRQPASAVLDMAWSVAQLFGSRVLGQAAGFLTAVLAARALAPEDFGLYSFSLVVAILLTAIPGTGLDLSAVRVSARHWATAPDRARGVLAISGLVRGGAGLMLAVPCALLAEPLAGQWLGRGELVVPLQFAALSSVAMVLTEFMLAILQARERFGQMLAINVIAAALKVVPVVVLVGLGSLTLLSALTASAVAAAVTGGLSLLIVQRTWDGAVQWGRVIAAEVYTFARWLVPATLLGALTASLDIVALTYLASAEVTGIYSSGRTLAFPLTVVGAALGTVLVPRLSRLPSPRAITHYIHRIGPATLAAVGGGTLLLVGLAPLVVPIIFGGTYAEAVAVFQILAIAYSVEVVTWIPLVMLMAYNRPDLIAAFSLVVFVITAIGYALIVPTFGAVGAAWVVLVSRVAIAVVYVLVAWSPRAVRMAPREPVALVSAELQKEVVP